MTFAKLYFVLGLICVTSGCKTSRSVVAADQNAPTADNASIFCSQISGLYARAARANGVSDAEAQVMFCSGQPRVVSLQVTPPAAPAVREIFDAVVRLRDGMVAVQPDEQQRWQSLNATLADLLRSDIVDQVANNGGDTPPGPHDRQSHKVADGEGPPSTPSPDQFADGGDGSPSIAPLALTGDVDLVTTIDSICDMFCVER